MKTCRRSAIRVEPLEGRLLFAAGEWDTTFGGGDGIADSGFAGHGEAIALTADGSILVAGSPDSGTTITGRIAVVRYHPNGTLDTSFGAGGGDGDGIVTAESGYGDTAGFILAVAPDGKILVGIDGASVSRFTADGQLDTTFDGGVVFPPSGHGQTMLAIRFDTGGKTLVGVLEAGPFTPGFGIIYRYNDDGTLDESYGQGGYELGYLPDEPDGGLSRIGPYNMWLPDEFAPTAAKVAHATGTPGAAVTQSDGTIVALVGAYTLDDRRDGHRAVVRFKPDGTLDPTFANAVRWGGANWMPGQVLIQPGTGRIVSGSGDGFRVVAVQSSPPLDQPLAVPDAPPEAIRTPPYPDAFEGNVTEVTFTVRYEDDRAIDISTIDGNDISVLLPSISFYDRRIVPVELVGIDAAGNAAVVTATYRFVNPKDRTLPVASGQYDLKMTPGQVLDDAGNAVAGGYLQGRPYFVVNSTATAIDAPPAATVVSATNVTDAATTAVRIVVRYQDDLGVIGSSIDGGDVRVTAPDGGTALATPVGGPFTGAQPQVDVTYEYVPAGGFAGLADGTYRISVEGGQVWDTSGALVPANASAGTFAVDLVTDGPNLTAGAVTAALRAGTVLAGRRPRGSVWFDVTNAGNRAAMGNVSFVVVASTDDQLDASDKQIAAATRRLSLRPAHTRRIRMRPGIIPPDLAAGDYHLLARADAGEQLTETDESDNVGPSPAPILHVIAAATRARRVLHAIEILRDGSEL